MVSTKPKEAGINIMRIMRKPFPRSTLPKTGIHYKPQHSFSLCEWCSTPEKDIKMGYGYYCPHYHDGTPCAGHPLNLIMNRFIIIDAKGQ